MNTVFNRNECPLRLDGTVTAQFQFWVLPLLAATGLPLNPNRSAVVVRGLILNEIQVALGRTYRS